MAKPLRAASIKDRPLDTSRPSAVGEIDITVRNAETKNTGKRGRVTQEMSTHVQSLYKRQKTEPTSSCKATACSL